MTEEDGQPQSGEPTPNLMPPWAEGVSGNPKGRPKGSRNKLGEAFVSALHDDFLENGPAAIVQVRTERPQDYLKVIASILPKEFKITDERELSDDELNRRIRELGTFIAQYIGDENGVPAVIEGSATATVN